MACQWRGLGILLGIDALIDPIRTSVNVASHCAAPAVVARWEGCTFADQKPLPQSSGPETPAATG